MEEQLTEREGLVLGELRKILVTTELLNENLLECLHVLQADPAIGATDGLRDVTKATLESVRRIVMTLESAL